MKKLVYKLLFIIVFVSLSTLAEAQVFVDGSIGLTLAEATAVKNSTKNGKQIHLQIGKFVNEWKMRAFSISYRNTTLLDQDEYRKLNGVDINTRHTVKASVFAIGYERKATFANTEFDDVWQWYNIINYRISFANISDEFSDTRANPFKQYQTSVVSPDFSIGVGLARKFNLKSYVYAELRGFGPILELDNNYTGIGIRTCVGVRHFF